MRGVALKVLAPAALAAWALAAVAAPEFFGQKLMVDQNGDVLPKGNVPGMSEIAALAASNEVAKAKVDVVQEVQEATSREVNLVVDTLTGVNAYAYVDDFVESLGGVQGVSTNASCRIAKFQIGARKETVDGVEYSAQELYYYFTEPMNNTPYIAFSTTLAAGETNAWEKVELQEPTYLGTAEVDGVEYDNLYKSTVWTLAALDKCFYRVQCKVSAPTGDGSTFDVVGGITVNGQAGATASLVAAGWGGVTNVLEFEGGLLKAVRVATEEDLK